MLNDQQLRQIMPHLKNPWRQQCLPHLQVAMHEFDLEPPLRTAAFLAQVAHESGELKFFEEIWGPTTAQRRYEGRRDLGNTQPGDGFRYRGRGAIQLTGRNNYRHYGGKLHLALEDQPDLASQPEVAFRIAAQFWADHGLNALADLEDLRGITRKINGGFNGFLERNRYYQRAKLVLAANQPPVAEIRITVNAKEVQAKAFIREGHVFAALRPLAEAMGLRVLEAVRGRAIVQDQQHQNHHLLLVIEGSIGFVPLKDLPAHLTWDARTGVAALETESTPEPANRDLNAATNERSLGDELLKVAMDLAFGFIKDQFGNNIPAAALDVIAPALVKFIGNLTQGSARIPPELRLLMQAELDKALRDAGLIGN
jgi:putative chitinase